MIASELGIEKPKMLAMPPGLSTKRGRSKKKLQQPIGNEMPIIVNLDVMLAKRKMRSKELAGTIGITEQNLSILKTGKAKALRFQTLEAICKALQCQPGDLLEHVSEEK